MQAVQQIVPISEFRLHQDNILEMMDKEPVILAQRSRPRAVLVSVDAWNAIVKQLEERQFSKVEVEAIIEAYQRAAEDRPTVTMEEHKARMAERYGHVTDKA